MTDFLQQHGLDIFTTGLGFAYIMLEYRASVWLWVVGIVMPALDVWLYYSHGLYGDAGMAVYYTLAAIYGLVVWLRPGRGRTVDSAPIFMPRRLYLRTLLAFLAAWAAVYWILVSFTDSTVPVQDAFTNALSFIGLWALSRKFVEQWVFWLIVDAFCCYLYVVKGIPFKALLYGAYVIIATAGWRRWHRIAQCEDKN